MEVRLVSGHPTWRNNPSQLQRLSLLSLAWFPSKIGFSQFKLMCKIFLLKRLKIKPMTKVDTWTNHQMFALQDSWESSCNWTKTPPPLQLVDPKTGVWQSFRGQLSSRGSRFKTLTNSIDLTKGPNLPQIEEGQSSKDLLLPLKTLKGHPNKISSTGRWLGIRVTKELKSDKKISMITLWIANLATKT